MIELKINCWRVCFLVSICVGSFCLTANGAELTDTNLRYSVIYQDSDAGELEIDIKKQGTQYVVKSISHLSLLAQMFLKSTTVESIFEQKNGELELISGREILNESGEVKRSFKVDTESSTINFSGGESVKFDKQQLIDADSFPLGLVLSDLTSRTGKNYLTVSPKRARLYAYQSLEKENLTVAAGTFDTLKVFSTPPEDSKRSVTIWMNTATPSFPVKIITSKNGKQTVMELLP